MVCTFFGHRDCYGLDRERLEQVLVELIREGVDLFYVGNQGMFDSMVYGCLKRLQARYPHIRYAVVLAYFPQGEQGEDTVFPEGLELSPPRFAIDRRNRWMLAQAQYCVCYVNHTWGGAYKFARMASNRGLRVMNLGSAELEKDGKGVGHKNTPNAR